jgi:hypothetical protein
MVRTPDFHSGNRGSTPLRVAKRPLSSKSSAAFCFFFERGSKRGVRQFPFGLDQGSAQDDRQAAGWHRSPVARLRDWAVSPEVLIALRRSKCSYIRTVRIELTEWRVLLGFRHFMRLKPWIPQRNLVKGLVEFQPDRRTFSEDSCD